jgi:hypothetical protein
VTTRWPNLQTYVGDYGKGREWTDFVLQVEFIVWEFRNTFPKTCLGLINIKNVTEATKWVQNNYEICNPKYCEQNKRIQYAKDALAKYGPRN